MGAKKKKEKENLLNWGNCFLSAMLFHGLIKD